MKISLPKSLVTITLLLIILAVGSLVSPLLSMPGGLVGLRQPGSLPPGGNFQNNGGNFQPNNDNFQNNRGAQGGGNFLPGDGNFPRRSAVSFLSLSGLLRTLGLGGQSMLYINWGVAVLGVGLTLLAAFGVWKRKKAGINLAMLLAVFFLLGSAGGVFSGLRLVNFSSLARYIISLINVGASAAILVFGMLPSVREEVV